MKHTLDDLLARTYLDEPMRTADTVARELPAHPTSLTRWFVEAVR